MGNNMQQTIREWYMKEYPTDELGAEIKENVTFEDLFHALDNYKNVYDLLAGDSVIRERAFAQLAELIHMDYDYVYEQWMRSVH